MVAESAPRRGEGTDELVDAYLRRAGRALERIARALPRPRLVEAVGAESDAEVLYRTLLEPAAVVEGIGGDEDADPLAAARLRGVRMKRELLRAEGGVLRAGQVAALLGISTQAVNKRRKAGALLGLDVGGGTRFLYPAFQFTERGGVVPGLREVLGALTAVEDPWMRASFLLTGDPRLGGRRPIDVLREGGDVGAVKAAAAAYGRQVAA